MYWYNTPLRKRIEALERRLCPEPPPKIRVIWPDGGEVWEVDNAAAGERPVARPSGLPARDSSRGRAETTQETNPKPTPPVHRQPLTKNPDPVLAAHQSKITPQSWPKDHPYADQNRLVTRPCRRHHARNARDAYILPFPDIAVIGSDPDPQSWRREPPQPPRLTAHESPPTRLLGERPGRR